MNWFIKNQQQLYFNCSHFYCHYYSSTTSIAFPKPLQRGCNGSINNNNNSKQIDSYPTVNVYCTTCSVRIFRYKKKNGTKSNLVKCYIERIIDDCVHVLRDQYYSNNYSNNSAINPNNSSLLETSNAMSTDPRILQHDATNHRHDDNNNNNNDNDQQYREYYCPHCQTKIARYARINHLPSLKWVGGKIRMSKK